MEVSSHLSSHSFFPVLIFFGFAVERFSGVLIDWFLEWRRRELNEYSQFHTMFADCFDKTTRRHVTPSISHASLFEPVTTSSEGQTASDLKTSFLD